VKQRTLIFAARFLALLSSCLRYRGTYVSTEPSTLNYIRSERRLALPLRFASEASMSNRERFSTQEFDVGAARGRESKIAAMGRSYNYA
jgi:hypothetical protein